MHAKFLQVDGGKMSKRLGNVHTVADVLARGHSARALRYALTRGHYRQPLNFTWEGMKDAESALESLDDLAARLRRIAGDALAGESELGRELVRAARAELEAALDDDLNVPRALAPLFCLRASAQEGKLGRAAAEDALRFLREANAVLAVIEVDPPLIDAEIEGLIAERRAARKRKDYAEADRIRALLLARGIALEDTASGAQWKRVR
jgi:cysteinyl-tRNA synthetase